MAFPPSGLANHADGHDRRYVPVARPDEAEDRRGGNGSNSQRHFCDIDADLARRTYDISYLSGDDVCRESRLAR
jgi:hypothetical protein